jgi:hypothetical protein
MVDVVISYVNPNDKKWQEEYLKYSKEGKEEHKSKRFRDTSFLKYVLRSIDKYMKFVNNVFLVVQSESQVPKWVNRDNVKIVVHEDFIPKEYLPTFNCNTIELHLHRIPNLSDFFIYFNDDIIVNKESNIEDFFKDGKCNLLSIKKEENVGKNTWYNCLLNNTKVINKYLGIQEKENIWHKYSHTITPLYKSLCEEAYNIFKEDIKLRITRFREYNNFNQHFYAYYIECCKKNNDKLIEVFYVNLNKISYKVLENKKDILTLCLNDNVIGDINEIKRGYFLATIWLEKKFNSKSKYEK